MYVKLFLFVVATLPVGVATAAFLGWRAGGTAVPRRSPGELGDDRMSAYLGLVDRATDAVERGDYVDAERLWKAADRVYNSQGGS